MSDVPRFDPAGECGDEEGGGENNICPKCSKEFGSDQALVVCDRCEQWSHIRCVLAPNEVPKEDDPWTCPACWTDMEGKDAVDDAVSLLLITGVNECGGVNNLPPQSVLRLCHALQLSKDGSKKQVHDRLRRYVREAKDAMRAQDKKKKPRASKKTAPQNPQAQPAMLGSAEQPPSDSSSSDEDKVSEKAETGEKKKASKPRKQKKPNLAFDDSTFQRISQQLKEQTLKTVGDAVFDALHLTSEPRHHDAIERLRRHGFSIPLAIFIRITRDFDHIWKRPKADRNGLFLRALVAIRSEQFFPLMVANVLRGTPNLTAADLTVIAASVTYQAIIHFYFVSKEMREQKATPVNDDFPQFRTQSYVGGWAMNSTFWRLVSEQRRASSRRRPIVAGS